MPIDDERVNYNRAEGRCFSLYGTKVSSDEIVKK